VKSEVEVTEDWLARREAMRAAKAPKLADVLTAIEAEVAALIRLAAEVEAGRVDLVDFMIDDRPGEVNVLAALMISRIT
jgi:hypothetical protein